MTKRKIQLAQIKVASPCNASWEGMTGDQRARFCGQCEKNVYDISGMSEDEAEQFLTESTGPVCVRLYRRSDGTIITNDCPIGLRAVRMKIVQVATATVALIGMLLSTVAYGAFKQNSNKPKGAVEALRDMSLIGLPNPPVGCIEMGEMAPLAPPLGVPAPVVNSNPTQPISADAISDVTVSE